MIEVKESVKRFREMARELKSTSRARHSLTVALWTMTTLGTLAVILALFRAAIVSYLGSPLAWWIVVGIVGGLIALQIILLAKKRGGEQVSLLGWLFGVIGMLGLAVLAAIFFSLAWPGVLIALLAGAWGRMVEETEKERSLEREPREVGYRAPAELEAKRRWQEHGGLQRP